MAENLKVVIIREMSENAWEGGDEMIGTETGRKLVELIARGEPTNVMTVVKDMQQELRTISDVALGDLKHCLNLWQQMAPRAWPNLKPWERSAMIFAPTLTFLQTFVGAPLAMLLVTLLYATQQKRAEALRELVESVDAEIKRRLANKKPLSIEE